jgi:hypothetical protein
MPRPTRYRPHHDKSYVVEPHLRAESVFLSATTPRLHGQKPSYDHDALGWGNGHLRSNDSERIGLARNLDETGRMIPDEELFAGLSDFTQDLNEMYADLGSEMSAWFDEQGPAVYRTVE